MNKLDPEVCRSVAEVLLPHVGKPAELEDVEFLLNNWFNDLFQQHCADCNTVMMVHDNITWRFTAHPIRCEACRDMAYEAGYSRYEAEFVV